MIIERKLISELVPAEYNPRKISHKDFERLKRSVEKFGIVEPIIWNKRTNRVVGGHQRLEVLRHTSEVHTDVVVVDLSENDEKALNIALNKISGDWDEPKLAELIKDLHVQHYDIDLTGFDIKDMKDLFGEQYLQDIGLKTVPQEDYEVPVEAHVRKIQTGIKRGDLFRLDRHLLLCGDATKQDDYDKLLGTAGNADMLLTDPPYNVGYEYETYDDNKTPDEYLQFCTQWYGWSRKRVKFAAITPGTVNVRMWAVIAPWQSLAPWIKRNTMNNGEWSHLRLWEPILFYGKPNKRRPTDLYEHNISGEQVEHTCPKPLPLFKDLIESHGAETVLDIFGGSGTTLIAAEMLGKTAYLMELDPQYCQVIIERWEKLTGKKAEKL